MRYILGCPECWYARFAITLFTGVLWVIVAAIAMTGQWIPALMVSSLSLSIVGLAHYCSHKSSYQFLPFLPPTRHRANCPYSRFNTN